MYQKGILILAVSKKHGGICLAGKNVVTKQWIRPVLTDPLKGFGKEHLEKLGFIGSEISCALAEIGCRVALLYNNSKPNDGTIKRIKSSNADFEIYKLLLK